MTTRYPWLVTVSAILLGWVGGLYGLYMTFEVASGLGSRFPEQAAQSRNVFVVLYGLSLALISLRARAPLLVVLVVLVAVNFITMLGFSARMIPATLMLWLSMVMLWGAADQRRAAGCLALPLLLYVALSLVGLVLRFFRVGMPSP